MHQEGNCGEARVVLGSSMSSHQLCVTYKHERSCVSPKQVSVKVWKTRICVEGEIRSGVGNLLLSACFGSISPTFLQGSLKEKEMSV